MKKHKQIKQFYTHTRTHVYKYTYNIRVNLYKSLDFEIWPANIWL